MRALTVRQPWAWAIVHGGKDVENRTRNVAGSYRGPVAIHAGLTPEAGYDNCAAAGMPLGAFVGIVDLMSVHHDSDHGRHRCSEWAEPDHWHLVLANPRPLPTPIPARGRLGLWIPEPVMVEQLQAVV